ncbi:unnamed protein product [Medioppia subpectinata]|uniref:Carboxylic ester hydrolase n=1 Tax=Medioppia subpectinata TaxID=1979941 RepID=A0A7R9KNS9_9ACAR|nr:unnamed protein product [Medioppia subpectinata]CAG2106965.1 unnamed protein product [Medioppia subpectinata]
MILKTYLLCLLVLTICLIVCCVCDGNSIDVNTSSGSVRGQTLHVLNHKIHQFLNIPYAEPPLGPLRFAPPLPLKAPKQDVIDGTVDGNSCIQTVNPMLEALVGKLTISEDCLTLGVWTQTTGTDIPSDQLKPVMFYIHGGALSMGSLYQKMYNGSILPIYDVVVVSVNYRLGQLGFLYGANETAPGNAGFYDQLLALKWVRDNIHSFGGDRDRITIFGESAGAWSLSAHLLSPLSKGLFKRAIIQSGTLMFNKDRPVLGTVDGLAKAKETARRVGCDPYDYKWLDCLRAIEDPNLILDTADAGEAFIISFPVFGTEFLPILPQKALESGKYNSDVHIMAGLTRDEGHMLAVALYPQLRAQNFDVNAFKQLVSALNPVYHNIDPDKVVAHYLRDIDTGNPGALIRAFGRLYGDLLLDCPTYLFAKRWAVRSENAVYFYRFSFQSRGFEMFGCDDNTICHGADITYVFGEPVRTATAFREIDYDFSLDVMKIWTNFAKNIKPHDVWPQLWDKSVIRVKDLNPNDMSHILDNPYESTCDGIWSQYF